jgi:quinol monooxygenase YgiN
MSIVVTAQFEPRPGRRDEVLAALAHAIPLVHDEPGCELYSIQGGVSGDILMIEKWTTVELLDAHGSSENVAWLNAALDGLLDLAVIVRRFDPIPSGGDKGVL